MDVDKALCIHADVPASDIRAVLSRESDKTSRCGRCQVDGSDIWRCLHSGCTFEGCGPEEQYHILSHREESGDAEHCVFVNCSSGAVSCLRCDDDETHAPARSGLVGLANLGNTCFMNAALQSLLNCEPLVAHIQDCADFVRVTTPERHPIVDSFIELVDQYWKDDCPSVLVPRALLHDVRTVNPIFRGYQQHDSQEFITTLLDKLNTEMATITHQPVFTDISSLPVGSHPGTPQYSHSMANTPRLRAKGHHVVSDGSANGPVTPKAAPRTNGLPGGSSDIPAVQDVVEKTRGGGDGEVVEDADDHDTLPRLLFGEKSQCQAAARVLRKHSIVSDLFEGVERSQVKCLQCGRESFKYDPFMTVLIEIGRCSDLNASGRSWWRSAPGWLRFPPPLTLQECLDRYTKIEHLDRYSCDFCGGETNSTKTLRFQTLPEVLVLVLKRFRHDHTFGAGKVSTHVTFPLEGLDMSPFLVTEAPSNPQFKVPDQRDETSPSPVYRLSAVVNHRGGLGGGHYVAYARNFVQNQWYEYDDSHVRPVSESSMENVEAYVLFYQRDATQQQLEVHQLYKQLCEPAGHEQYFISRQWFTRWLTLSSPGPINNRDVCCEHGGISPCLASRATRFFVRVTPEVFAFLHRKYGGGPSVRQLSTCVTCEIAHSELQWRREEEHGTVERLLKNEELTENEWYMMPTRWFEEWESFTRSTHQDHTPPGPIEMHHIIKADGTPTRNLRSGTHYYAFTKPLWAYMAGIYGVCGGEPYVCVEPNIYSGRWDRARAEEASISADSAVEADASVSDAVSQEGA